MSTEPTTEPEIDAEFDNQSGLQQQLDQVDTDGAAGALLEDLVAAVENAQSDARTARQMASDAQSRLLDVREEKTALEDQIERLQADNEALRSRIDELQSRTDLMDQVANGSAMKIDKRAAVCIQTLYNEAWKRKHAETSDAPTASMDYNKAAGALGGTISRSSILRTFAKADELVDGDVVQFKTEDRSSKKNSRLVIDLSESEPPQTVAGQEITTPEEGN